MSSSSDLRMTRRLSHPSNADGSTTEVLYAWIRFRLVQSAKASAPISSR